MNKGSGIGMQRKRGEGRFIFFEGLLCTRFYDTGARCVQLVNPRPIHLVLEILQRELLPHCKAKETEAFVTSPPAAAQYPFSPSLKQNPNFCATMCLVRKLCPPLAKLGTI